MRTYHWEEFVRNLIESIEKATNSPAYFPDVLSFWERFLGVKDHRGVQVSNGSRDLAGVMGASSLYMHHQCGQQVFELSKPMLDMFLRTDLTGVTLDDLMLPYDCLYIALPKGMYKLWGGARTGYHECNGVYVRRRLYFEMPKDIAMAIGEENMPRLGHINDIIPMLKSAGLTPEEVINYQKQGFNIHAACLANDRSLDWTDDCHTWCHISLCDWNDPKYSTGKENDVENFLRKKLFTEMEDAGSNELACVVDKDSDTHAQQFFNICKVALNTLVYLNNGLEVKTVQRRDNGKLNEYSLLYDEATSPSKRRTYGRKVTRLCKPTVRVLGPGIQATLGAEGPLDVLVRGHWHTYWVGKNRAMRKLNWIQPYIRNKSAGINGEEPRVYSL